MELKAKGVDDVYLEYFNTGKHDLAQVYLKTEVDKVIAEKDEEIAELKEQVHDYALGLYVIQAKAEKEARRHKYRHCLDMAYKCVVLCQKSKDLYRWAEDENLEHHYNHKIEFFARWHKRWLELAEKFEEATK